MQSSSKPGLKFLEWHYTNGEVLCWNGNNPTKNTLWPQKGNVMKEENEDCSFWLLSYKQSGPPKAVVRLGANERKLGLL